MKSIIETLLHAAVNHPHKAALIVGGESLTYQELVDRMIAVSEYFSRAGVVKGSKVVLSADPSAAFVYGYFACHYLSAVCVPIDPKCSEGRLLYIVEKVCPKLIFSDCRIESDNVSFESIGVLHNYCKCKSEATFNNLPEMNDLADIIFTSGTTGDAKGVMLTHKAISTAADHINRFIGNGTDDVEVMPLPLSHSFGLGRLRCNIVMGATIVLVPGFASPPLIFQALEEHRATGLASVPAGFSILLSVDRQKLARYSSQLRYIEIGSAPMPMEDKKSLINMLPDTRICMHYGLTEASRSVFIEFHADENNLSSIGRPAEGVSVEIVDEHGERCPPGQPGRIKLKGGHCTEGYWGNAALTNKVISDGWLLTGDYGYFDSSGYLYLQARESDLINVGGRKVSPSEIENLLLAHPSIMECACVGIDDPRGIAGQAVKAFLVSADEGACPLTNFQLAKILRGKIEPYKMPVAFEWIKKIPRTESGKIKRNALK